MKTKISIRIDNKRLNDITPETINQFFDQLESVLHIPSDQIYNINEVGIMEGLGINSLILGSSAFKGNKSYIRRSNSYIWITMIECISVACQVLIPIIIFKGIYIQ